MGWSRELPSAQVDLGFQETGHKVTANAKRQDRETGCQPRNFGVDRIEGHVEPGIPASPNDSPGRKMVRLHRLERNRDPAEGADQRSPSPRSRMGPDTANVYRGSSRGSSWRSRPSPDVIGSAPPAGVMSVSLDPFSAT
jgi:hypothetical protein